MNKMFAFISRGTQDEDYVDKHYNENKRESVLDISELKTVSVNKEMERRSAILETPDDKNYSQRSDCVIQYQQPVPSPAQERIKISTINEADTEDEKDRMSFTSRKQMWEQATLERREKKKSNVKAPDLLKDVFDAEDDVVDNEKYTKLVRDTAV